MSAGEFLRWRLNGDWWRPYRGTRALVIGGAGFIGRWVARYLTAAGAELTLLVRDPVAAEAVVSRYGIQANVLVADLADDSWPAGLAAARPAIVFNLAGYGVDRSERDEQTAYAINARLPAELCETLAGLALPNWPGQRLVHVGSALEYGEVAGDLNETCEPHPTTLYGLSKLAGTQAVADCAGTHSLPCLTARLFTVYGPGEHPGRLLPSLLAAAGNDSPLELTSGLQKRDFTYVGEVAEGLLRLGLAKPCWGDAVNLAAGHLTSVRDFVLTAAEVLQLDLKRLKFGAVPTRAEEMAHQPVANQRLCQLVDWRPTLTVREGISLTHRFFEHQ